MHPPGRQYTGHVGFGTGWPVYGSVMVLCRRVRHGPVPWSCSGMTRNRRAAGSRSPWIEQSRSRVRCSYLVPGAAILHEQTGGAGTVGVVMVSLLGLVVHRLRGNEMSAVTRCLVRSGNMPDAAGGSDGRQGRLGVTAQPLRMV